MRAIRLRRLMRLTICVGTAALVLSACASPVPSLPARTASPTAVPVSASPALAHLSANKIGFDYPASWTQRPGPPGGVPVFGGITFVGTAPSTAGCHSIGPNSTTCGPDFALTPGTISIAVYWLDGPMTIDPFAPMSDPGRDGRRVFVDGVPATRTSVHVSPYNGSFREVTLTLPGPSITAPPILVLAEFVGPPEDALLAQAEAVLDSVHYEPRPRPTAAMDLGAATAAARAAVERLKSDTTDSSAQPCFEMPGEAARTVVLKADPFGQPLLKSLSVTCSTAIEGTPIEVWKFVLTISWQAAADRNAGSAQFFVWVGTDGIAFPFDRSGDQVPYQS